MYFQILGGSAENWTDIAEYLVHRGATKIVVASENKPQSNYINRRLSVLHTYYGAEIIMAPNKANTKETASELLSEGTKYYISNFITPFARNNYCFRNKIDRKVNLCVFDLSQFGEKRP